MAEEENDLLQKRNDMYKIELEQRKSWFWIFRNSSLANEKANEIDEKLTVLKYKKSEIKGKGSNKFQELRILTSMNSSANDTIEPEVN